MSLRKIPFSKATNAYELLNDVCRVVTEEPKRVYMPTFITAFNAKYGPACGTVGCIAGWVTILKRPRTAKTRDEFAPDGHVEDIAIGLLGDGLRSELSAYSILDGLFTSELFDATGNEIKPTYGTRAYARAVVRKIRAFQKTHKAALLAKAV